MRRTASLIPAAILLAIIAVTLWAAAGVFHDTAEGFCLQLEPCEEAQP